MRTLTHEKHTLELYDSPEELPILHTAALQRFVCMSAEVPTEGGTIQDALAKAVQLITYNETESAVILLQNILFGLHLSLECIQPGSLAFAALVRTINGQPVQDTTDSGLQETLKKINAAGIPTAQLAEACEEVKKNFSRNARFSSPTISAALLDALRHSESMHRQG